MIRLLQIAIVLLAAIPASSCTALAIARQRMEIRSIEEEWGANKSKNIFIYQP
jgi:hypothetical protein